MKRFRDTNYIIGENGEVFNLKKDRYLKSYLQNGYLAIYILGKKHRIHRLVAECYIPNPDNLPWINHLDGNKLNNHYSNLEWCTPSRNIQHSYDLGLKPKMYGNKNSLGIKNHNTILTEEQVKEIRLKYTQGLTFTQIRKLYNVSHNAISYIVKRKTWKHLD